MGDNVVPEKGKCTTPLSVLVAALFTLFYFCLFYWQLDGRWFSPDWTTDDATQQTFLFHEVFEPDIWRGDLIALVMRGYLAPLHYWLTYALTALTGSPIQAGHLVMAVQMGLTCIFLFAGIRAYTGSSAPALFACAWFVHTRTVVQRLTGGLPRGWGAPLFAMFLYCVLTKRHKTMLFVIFCGCLLNPPVTFLVGVAYGLWLLFLFCQKSNRAEAFKALKHLLLCAPVFMLTTLYVIHRPPEVGQMVNYETAKEMPAFNRKGRFSFIPQPSIRRHIKTYGYNAFVTRLHNPGETIATVAPYAIATFLLLFLYASSRGAPNAVPSAVWAFFVAIVAVYLTSRQVLFKLYVPNRHLLFPMTFFLITTFSIGLWTLGRRAGRLGDVFQTCKYLLLGIGIFLCSGDGLQGDANFNYHKYRKGKVFEWIRDNTPRDSIIAGHPTHIDPVLLFGKRRAYVTSETAHPFYKKFYDEMERRLEISLRAHYAATIGDFLAVLDGEDIDYFVFSRMRFYGKSLKTAHYFRPLDSLVKELTSGDFNAYAYKRLPKKVNTDTFAPLLFRDNESALVDIAALRAYVASHPDFARASL